MTSRSHTKKPGKRTADKAPAVVPLTHDTGSFPIVGIGASAGGLEALERFFRHVPYECGFAFIIVQHLDPTHKAMMAELLQRITPLPVIQIHDRMKVEPDHIYVIPPNSDLSLLHGILHLIEPASPRGLQLPIDFFFRSLAIDVRDSGIGVILSGMGSDGTLGLQAIKENGGGVFVQAPDSAKFDSMPRSAVNTGLADVIVSAEELPGRIIAYLQHVSHIIKPGPTVAEKDQSSLEKAIILLRAHTGHDFSLYKKSTTYRRIERRMGIHQIVRIEDYVRYLRENSQELNLLFKELLIGVTGFFRDPAVWEQLSTEVIPALLSNSPDGKVLRAWTPGCSTGEEAYSLAMVFQEAVERVQPNKFLSLQIYATDLDRDAIDKARAGVYPSNIAADVSEERLRRFFIQDEQGGGYRIGKQIREMAVFAQQNVIMDPPFTKLDFLSCRNLLIYMVTELQRKLLPLFHYGLNPGGILLLGSAETIGSATDLFAPLPGKTRFFRRMETSRTEPIEYPSAFTRSRALTTVGVPPWTAAPSPVPNLQALADQLLVQYYCPAAVLVNREGDIIYTSGKTGDYLEPAAGKANWNIFVMARKGLAATLDEAFRRAIRQKERVTLKAVMPGAGGGTRAVDVTVQPLAEPEALRAMVMVVFTEAATAPAADKIDNGETAVAHDAQIESLTHELLQAREEMRINREEMQTSQEELRSANEELQSTNEELQSTNEELTTSKEEMQSMNEELLTVNNELSAKVEELSRIASDMKNLLDSTDIATLFLDDALRVRRFTSRTTSLFKLIPIDIGRSITDITSDLDYPALSADAREVLRTLVFIERQIATCDKRWFSIRIMPYRSLDNRIDGVVITFSDISATKNLEAELRATETSLRVLLQKSRGEEEKHEQT
ncbi:MAG: PAS domain-containing protein [Chitinispirillaceae bacterium]|nr:PAS domain-containing protein [Chitinispirillaceae bacterium]